MRGIKDGYKETEIGVLPEDWEVVELKKIAPFISNGFVGTASPYYTEDEEATLYLMGNNIRENRIDTRTLVRINDEFVGKYPKTRIYEGDMLTVQSGHIGTSCIITKDFDNSNCHAVIISRFNRELVHPDYQAYYLNSLHGKRRLKSIFVGTTIKHINTKDLKLFIVPLPPLPEQHRIAEILSATDAHLEKLEAIIADTQLFKKGMMQSLLTRGIGHTEFKDTEIGQMPLAWEVKKLGEVTKFIRDGSHGSHKDVKDGIPLLSAKDIINNKIQIPNDCRRISEIDYEKLHKNYELEIGDVLITIVGTIGRTAVIETKNEKFTFQRSVGIIRPNGEMFPQFLKQYMNSDVFQKQLSNSVNASAQGGVYLKTLNNLIVVTPPLLEQYRIAEILSAIDHRIQLYEIEKESFIQLKKGLMGQLLTGKIRVN